MGGVKDEQLLILWEFTGKPNIKGVQEKAIYGDCLKWGAGWWLGQFAYLKAAFMKRGVNGQGE